MFAILQQENPKKFAVIKGKVTASGCPDGYKGKDWDYIQFDGKVILNDCNISDAREICEGLNNGNTIADYGYGVDPDPYRYGSEEHQLFGDRFIYNNEEF